MADLRQAARRLLDAVEDGGHKSDVMAAADALRAELAQQAEPVQGLILADEKDALDGSDMPTTGTPSQGPGSNPPRSAPAVDDYELSAALGWPGGVSTPVVDRGELLQMVAQMRLAIGATQDDAGNFAVTTRDAADSRTSRSLAEMVRISEAGGLYDLDRSHDGLETGNGGPPHLPGERS